MPKSPHPPAEREQNPYPKSSDEPRSVGHRCGVDGDALISLLNRLPDGVIVLDRTWRITFANEEARRISRLLPHDLNSRTHWDLYPETAGTEVERVYREVMQTGISTSFEHYHAPFDIHLHVHVLAMPDGIAVNYRDISGRKRAEALRDATARRLNQVLEVTTDAVVSLDRNWNYTFFNTRAVELLGRDDLLGKNLWQEYPAAIDSDFSANYRRCMAERVPTEFEAYYPAPLERWLSLLCRPSDDGMVVFFRDITERRRSELVFRQQRDLITFVQQASRTAFWNLDLASGKLSFDVGSYPVFGHELSKLTDISAFRAIVDPEDRAQVNSDVAHAVATGELVVNEFRVIDAEGRTVWLEARSQAKVVEGRAITLGGMTIDITERKRDADALHEKQLETERQRAELESLYQTAPIGLALFDPVEFRYLRLNERQAEIVGLPADEVLGKRLTEIAPIPGLNEMFQKVASGTPIRNAMIEGTVAARPEEHRFWAVNYFPVYQSDGIVRAITAASLEITAQKKAELALIESEKLAAVGRLATSISHEINNPLEAVTNLLYLIATDPHLPVSIAGYVDTAQSEVARVCQIATQTLRFHRQAVRATWVTAEELVGAVMNLYLGRLVNSGITVEARYDTETPLLCLENDIRQVLNNLIDNAIHAMRHGGRLLARAHDATRFSAGHPEGQRGLRIVIADTGHGMSAEVMARVFEPFYTTKALNGTGLGLWISSGIIERHDGSIRIRSSENPERHGTVFSIFLPHISEAEIEAATPLMG